MLYLDVILTQQDERGMLYVNGKKYNDIDNEEWAECIFFLRHVLPKDIIITKRVIDGYYKDLPNHLDCESYEYRWSEIWINNVKDYIGKVPVKCEIDDKMIIIKPEDKFPEQIDFNTLLRGNWYALIQ